MQIAPSEVSIFFDVDDTLIFWDDQSHKGPAENYIEMVCPHDGLRTHHRVHERHVKFLKKQKAKGYTVVVWSASGTKWAAEVIKKLGIEDYVDYVISKPVKWVDDLSDANHNLGTHIYLSEDGHSI